MTTTYSYSWDSVKESVNIILKKHYQTYEDVDDVVGTVYNNVLPRAVKDALLLCYTKNDQYNSDFIKISFAYNELEESGTVGSKSYQQKFEEHYFGDIPF